MKRFFIGIIIVLCVQNAIAGTTQWYVDGSVYQTTTCSSGDDVTPPTPPTKYGYTFAGWKNTALIRGTWSQSGTPTPDNPIYPTFYQNGDLILRAIGTGNNIIQDVYNQETGKIIRNIGVKVLDGTESWNSDAVGSGGYIRFVLGTVTGKAPGYDVLSDAFRPKNTTVQANETSALISGNTANTSIYISFPANLLSGDLTTATGRKMAFNNWLADQYAAGTPVTIYYPLETPVEENYTQN